jgi:hypothetical protein
MTLRKYSIIAAIFATAHFVMVAATVWGSMAIAINRTITEPQGSLESTLNAASDVLLLPLGLLWEPKADTPVVVGLAAVAANGVLWGCVFAMTVGAIIAARAKRAAS